MQKQRNVVSLTVHKNTLPKRRGRENARILSLIAKEEHRQGDVAGFAVITWNESKLYSCRIHAPERSPIGLNEINAFVSSAITREIAKSDADNS